jgi:hypothetical protein
MPSIQERIVATGRGVRAERDLAKAAADFYVLELLTARGDPDAARMLSRLEAGLAEEFACYLDMAIGGELRYAMQHLGKEALPHELACFFREIDPSERGAAWLTWNVVRRALGLRALELAAELFRTPGWAENFGGQAWAVVARLLRDHLQGRVIARVFVDQCFSLEHNTGSVFNKLYETESLAEILETQYLDDYRTLLRHASEAVRRCWRLYEWRRRQEHDPVWLGVQVTDTYDELVGEVTADD